ncbi:acyl-CoA dehydrogenase family protein [Zafaria sp. J156]|uniref:acyl-CoA dehydrogenase family protein n=1 Tax=Zafaria sp. J156 TaxID=3116490 RepID=UPI002E778C67|nr:acyl-CoA dehydrogenase family protein [Zafaria sp. J156]MEE1621755.1 acyl-CoA dehydrogenase family protein [Zafaria sp. J156]
MTTHATTGASATGSSAANSPQGVGAPTAVPARNPAPAGYAALHVEFAPLFSRIAEGARQRDLDRELPFEPVRLLDAAGFGALLVPEGHGGRGASIETFARLLIDLAAADSNVAHLYRSHFGFIESLRWQEPGVRRRWYARAVAGETVGNASTERGGNALGTLNTTLSRADGAWRLDGTKYYSTGTIFSDYTRVSAQVAGSAGRRFAVVPVAAEGVRIEDDWDGFGQRLTGTGTAVFSSVAVDPADVLDRVVGTAEAVHEAAFFQLVLLAVLAGIARAARDDAAAVVASRARTFNTGSGLPFREDPLIQEVVGGIAAKAFTAEATVLAAARALDEAVASVDASVARAASGDGAGSDAGAPPAAPGAPWLPAATREGHLAELAVEQAQVSVPELALAAAQQLFAATGASATSTSKGLDRHWRNAQTVATHNPAAFRARTVGDYFVNGTLPQGLNAIGDATSGSATAPGRS